jgi:hypothetical protein
MQGWFNKYKEINAQTAQNRIKDKIPPSSKWMCKKPLTKFNISL